MNGRVEIDIEIYKKIEEQLINYPNYIISWYYYLKANDQSAMTCRDYIHKVIQFLKFNDKDINNIQLNNLNENIIIQYMNNIKYKTDGSETSVSYRQSVWSCLNNFYKFLYNRNLIQINYFDASGVKRAKGNDLDRINRNRTLLTQEDFKNILNMIEQGVGSNKAKGYQKSFKNRDKAILLIFMTTGIRKTALEEINVSDIDFDNHKLYSIDKGHKLHEYYLNDEVIETLNKWIIDRYFILGQKNDGALFISNDNKRMHGNTIAKLVDKYAYAALGYHISPHKLRSGFASIMYEQTGDIEFVRRVIGHSQISTTQRYIVTNNGEREEAAEMMNQLLA